MKIYNYTELKRADIFSKTTINILQNKNKAKKKKKNKIKLCLFLSHLSISEYTIHLSRTIVWKMRSQET